MEYKKLGGDKTKYLKFIAGTSFEGVFKGAEERHNPFFKATDPESPTNKTIITDYHIEIDGVEKVLSSTAESLKGLKDIAIDTGIKIDCIQQGIKKYYAVGVAE